MSHATLRLVSLVLFVMAVMLVSVSPAQASIIIVKPTTVTATSSIPDNPSQYQSPNHMIDGSGLPLLSPLNTGDPVPVTWPTHTTAQGDLWVANLFPQSPNFETWTLDFSLPSLAAGSLTGFHLWNENEPSLSGRDAKNYTVAYSTNNGGSFTSFTASPDPFTVASGSSSYTGADYLFSSPLSAASVTDVKFTLTSNYAGANGFIGLSEIRFVEDVPEPASMALLLVGGLLLLRRCRDRGRVAA